MNCKQVRQLLSAYHDGDVSPSERMLIRSHLAGCDLCQQELATMSAARDKLSQFLKRRAAQAAPSPQAWSRLQASLADRPPSRLSAWLKRPAPVAGRAHSNAPLKGTVPVKTRIALAAAAIALLVVAAVALVPPARAQVADFLHVVFHIRIGDTEIVARSEGAAMTYQVMQPAYLPNAFANGPTSLAVGDSSELVYQSGDQFLVITQRQASEGESLPAGQATTVNGQPAVLNTGLSGTYQEMPRGTLEASGSVAASAEEESGVFVQSGEESGTAVGPGSGQPVEVQPITFSYSDANRLTWNIGSTRIEILSNLPVEEMTRIAEGLAPAE